MLKKAQRISQKKDNVTWCRPNEGYNTSNAIEIESDDYEEIGTVLGDLPENDEDWPKGAPMTNYVKIGDKILKKKAKSDLR
jgi:hypothetical protein